MARGSDIGVDAAAASLRQPMHTGRSDTRDRALRKITQRLRQRYSPGDPEAQRISPDESEASPRGITTQPFFEWHIFISLIIINHH